MLAAAAAAIFLVLPCAALQPAEASSSTEPASGRKWIAPSEPDIESVQRERVESADLSLLMDRLGVRPGDSILDLGAGWGYYTYGFAERLKGTGQVYATDCDAKLIAHLSAEATRRGLGNVRPVLVQKKGIDPFYGQHKFDLIYLSHVFYSLEPRIPFLAALREALTEHGRVVVVHYDWTPYSESVQRPQGLVAAVAALAADDPFRSALSSATLAELRSPGADARQAAAGIVRDFNAAVRAGFFSDRLIKDGRLPPGLPPSPRQRAYGDHLLVYRRTLARAGLPFPEIALQCLNALLLESRFKPYLAAPSNKTAERIKQDMATAGYRFDSAFADFAPMEFALVFDRARP